jgi:hypothetical protein
MDNLKKTKETNLQANEPQVVAEFHINRVPTQTDQFLMDYNHCCLCGNELLFTHVTDFVALHVQEESFCTKCNIRTRQNHHGLQ